MRSLKIALFTIFKPMDAFPFIQERGKRFNYIPGVVLMALMILSRMFYLTFSGYIMSPEFELNVQFEIVKLMLPIFTWIIACYGVTTIAGGETFIREIFTSTAYATIPYTISVLILTALSQFFTLTKNEVDLFNLISDLFTFWMLFLIFVSVMKMNEYSFMQTVGVCITAVVFMGIIWAVGILLYGLIGQFFEFIDAVIVEFRLFQNR